MESSVCSVLTPLYSVVVLAVVVNRRSVHIHIRREKFFQHIGFATALTAILGIVISVLGLQNAGLSGFFASLNWAAFAVALIGLAITLFAIIASAELEEDTSEGAEIDL